MSLATVDEGAIVARVAPASVAAESLNKHATLVDSLSYVETGFGASEQRVNALIEAEMESMRQSGVPYPQIPEAPNPFAGRLSEAMRGELARVAAGEDLEPMPIERYACEAPQDADAADPAAWKGARDNVRSQLGHQVNRVINLELAESFSETAWRRHVQDLEAMKQQLVELAQAKRKEAERVNLKRKADQEQIAPEILRCEKKAQAQLEKHFQLETEIAKLRAQLAAAERPTAE